MMRQRRQTESLAALVILTPREKQIIRLVARGLSNKSVAQMLVISDSTVEFHLRRIYRKWGVHNRTSAVVVAIRHGVISKP